MRVDVCAGVHVFDYINVRVLAEYSPNPQAVQNEDRYKVYIQDTGELVCRYTHTKMCDLTVICDRYKIHSRYKIQSR